MKFSWTSLKISIAGAKLSHLVQKDKIWDHGSMAEQARIIFYLVQKAKASGNTDTLKKQCSVSCFEKLRTEMEQQQQQQHLIGPAATTSVIKELAIVDVQPGRNNKPDMFCAIIKGNLKDTTDTDFGTGGRPRFIAKWSFIRQGDWWVLDNIQNIKSIFSL